MFSYLIISASLLVVIVQTLMHLPPWLSRAYMRLPVWFQTLLLHFGYASWLGGVTGHLCGAILSLPYYYLDVDTPPCQGFGDVPRKTSFSLVARRTAGQGRSP